MSDPIYGDTSREGFDLFRPACRQNFRHRFASHWRKGWWWGLVASDTYNRVCSKRACPTGVSMTSDREALANAFQVQDIWTVNWAMDHALGAEKAAWERVKAKLIQAADIKPPRLTIPHEMVDEDGFIKPHQH